MPGSDKLTVTGEAGVKRHAAVDEEAGARDIAGFVAGKPHGCFRHILGFADPPVVSKRQKAPAGPAKHHRIPGAVIYRLGG